MKTELTAVFTVQERDDDVGTDLIEAEFTEAEVEIRFEDYRDGKAVQRHVKMTHEQMRGLLAAQEAYLAAHTAVRKAVGA